MPRNAFNGTIESITVLGVTNFFDGHKQITGYDGSRFFCHYDVQQIGGQDVIVIKLNDVSSGTITPSIPPPPPPTTTPPTPLPSLATVEVNFVSQSQAIATPFKIPYAGGLLVAGATIDPTSASLYDQAMVTLTIVEKKPKVKETDVEVPGYVVTAVTSASGNTTFQLRWVDNPVLLADENHSIQRVPSARPKGSGAGIVGPMGIETP